MKSSTTKYLDPPIWIILPAMSCRSGTNPEFGLIIFLSFCGVKDQSGCHLKLKWRIHSFTGNLIVFLGRLPSSSICKILGLRMVLICYFWNQNTLYILSSSLILPVSMQSQIAWHHFRTNIYPTEGNNKHTKHIYLIWTTIFIEVRHFWPDSQ